MPRYRVEAIYRRTIHSVDGQEFEDIWVEADSPQEAHDAVEADDEELMVIEVYTEDGEYCIY